MLGDERKSRRALASSDIGLYCANAAAASPSVRSGLSRGRTGRSPPKIKADRRLRSSNKVRATGSLLSIRA